MKATTPVVPLESAYSFQEGPGLRKWQFKSEGIKVLNVGNITKDGRLDLSKTDRFISEEEVNARYQHFLVDDGDLVIASSGVSFDEDGLLRTRGVFVDKKDLPLCMNTSTIRFKPKKNISDLRYLRHWIDGLEFRAQISRLVTGSAQQNFGPSHLRSIQITLPSLDEQRRIAAILDKADALRRQRKLTLDLLESLTQAIFLKMFGDLMSNSRGWGKTQALGDLADIVSGITKGRKLNGEATREVPYLAVSNVQDKFLDLSIVKTIHASKNEIQRYRLKKDDLLLTEGGDPDKLGRGTLWADELSESIHQNHIFRVRANSPKVTPIYLIWLLGSRYGKAYFLRSAKQTTGIASINKRQLSDFPVVLPPIGLQAEFKKRADSVKRLLQTNSQNRIATDLLFSSLQSRAFSDQL